MSLPLDHPWLTSAVSYAAKYPFMDSTLWVPHCVLMCCSLRQFLGDPHWRRFSRANPLACAALGLIYIFPGGIVGNLLLAQPLLSFLSAPAFVLPAVVSWYLVFYAPYDFFYKLIGMSCLFRCQQLS